MKTEACPKCGSAKRERGQMYPMSELTDIRFKSETSSAFSFKKEVAAWACSSCGYIELFLKEHDGSGVA
jgi:predicted nucleic-acid-binding Zn-ribbon protein